MGRPDPWKPSCWETPELRLCEMSSLRVTPASADEWSTTARYTFLGHRTLAWISSHVTCDAFNLKKTSSQQSVQHSNFFCSNTGNLFEISLVFESTQQHASKDGRLMPTALGDIDRRPGRPDRGNLQVPDISALKSHKGCCIVTLVTLSDRAIGCSVDQAGSFTQPVA